MTNVPTVYETIDIPYLPSSNQVITKQNEDAVYRQIPQHLGIDGNDDGREDVVDSIQDQAYEVDTSMTAEQVVSPLPMQPRVLTLETCPRALFSWSYLVTSIA